MLCETGETFCCSTVLRNPTVQDEEPSVNMKLDDIDHSSDADQRTLDVSCLKICKPDCY